MDPSAPVFLYRSEAFAEDLLDAPAAAPPWSRRRVQARPLLRLSLLPLGTAVLGCFLVFALL